MPLVALSPGHTSSAGRLADFDALASTVLGGLSPTRSRRPGHGAATSGAADVRCSPDHRARHTDAPPAVDRDVLLMTVRSDRGSTADGPRASTCARPHIRRGQALAPPAPARARPPVSVPVRPRCTGRRPASGSTRTAACPAAGPPPSRLARPLAPPQVHLPVDSHGRGFRPQARLRTDAAGRALSVRRACPRPVAPASPTPLGVGTRVTTPAHPPKGGGRGEKQERQECRKPGNHQLAATQLPTGSQATTTDIRTTADKKPPNPKPARCVGTGRAWYFSFGAAAANNSAGISGPCRPAAAPARQPGRDREPAGAPVTGRSRRGPTRGWTPQAAPRPGPARPRGPRSPSASPGGDGGRRPSTARRQRR